MKFSTRDRYALRLMVELANRAGADALVPLKEISDAQQISLKYLEQIVTPLTKAGLELYQQLRTLRFEIAQREGLPPYVVFGDKSLVDMCLRAPRRAEDMLGIYGMGERKFAKYGKQFFAAIEDYRREHPEAEFTGA